MPIICVLTFFLSSIIDNLTSTIVAVKILRRLTDNKEPRHLKKRPILFIFTILYSCLVDLHVKSCGNRHFASLDLGYRSIANSAAASR